MFVYSWEFANRSRRPGPIAGSGAPPSYSTTFPVTEGPISEAGAWTIGDNGGTKSPAVGPVTTGGSPGTAYAAAADGADYLAIIKGRFSGTRHYAEATIRRDVGYTAPDTHELELLVGFDLGTDLSCGYELDFWFSGGTLQTVRWNTGSATGAHYDFGAVTVVSGTWPSGAFTDGDVVRAEFDSSSGSPVITMYLNGVLQITYTDTTAGKILSGSPGMGFFARPGADLPRYAIKGFRAGSL